MIVYTDSLSGITAEKLDGFFVGWPKPPSRETHLKILRNAAHIVLAIDDVSGQVVGFINAVSDNVLAAYIPLLEVLPSYQNQGIAGELIRRMLEKLNGLYMIDLVADPPLESFYAPLGFRPGFAMMIRNFDRQSGV